jgi:hypothetical protein
LVASEIRAPLQTVLELRMRQRRAIQRKAQKLGIRSSVDRFGKTMDKA